MPEHEDGKGGTIGGAGGAGGAGGGVENAESVFSQYLKLRERGEDPGFDDFVASHPEMKMALQVLHSIYVRGQTESVSLSLGDKLARHFGGDPEETRSWSPVQGEGPPLPLGDLTAKDPERYVNRDEVARGGMGVILRVFDRDLKRALAMKVIRGDASAAVDGQGSSRVSPEHLARFLEEAQVTAQLDHPGIVPVHDLGLDADGRVYFTMQLVKGCELREIFELAREEKEGWNLPRAVGVMVKACQAIAYAHSKSVIHRDLKPANIMVGRFGEVYIMDWGLAKVLERDDLHDIRPRSESETTAHTTIDTPRGAQRLDSPLLTMDGTVVGTPAYMAPEQAAGKVPEVDASSDVYALGAMLYTLLTGRIPYVPNDARVSPHTILARVLDGPPQPIQRFNPNAPAELVAICDKAMARSKAERYVSSLELAEDLQAYLDGRVVRAYESGAVAEFKKWVGRNRALATAVTSALLLLFVGLVFHTVTVSIEKNRVTYERNRVLRLSDVKRLQSLVREADELWPALPRNVPAMTSWLEEAGRLTARLEEHQEDLALLERSQEPDAETLWHRDALRELVEGLELFTDPARGTLNAVKNRLAFANSVRALTIKEYAEEWAAAVTAIADEARNPVYGGYRLEPQIGLVPLGPDPRSGFFEFAHLETGSAPARDASGHLQIEEGSGIVFVLLPGGSFRMGAELPRTATPRAANIDPAARDDEGPVHDVTLEPFFISKYEMTQGQWRRFTGTNPSELRPGLTVAGRKISERHPVENVSLQECRRVLRRLGMNLPTEAQWEYATRGGTSTPWWTGETAASTLPAANVADQAFMRSVRNRDQEVDAWDDGYASHAPVGSFAANPFGLHDVIGNVWEWVRDGYEKGYVSGVKPGEGERVVAESEASICRGGGFSVHAADARSANRLAWGPDNRDNDLGLRPIFVLQGD